eukprot:TRINITY_DN2272_c0_g1_i2.p1 TRINITY_DN2272_c0_g1~~TRINITY_DN2272_c0_g1_i2.p1  ORF type:complete len:401 (-),score=68.07 TRINITY_DN2272_c0_g1_i2:61-1263(-)
MARITTELIKCSTTQRQYRGESIESYLNRLTHLTLNGKGLTHIDALQRCPNLQVLYLYDNSLSRIENLGFANNLTHLYLQNNQLQSLDGLLSLKFLKKLYLDGNSIHRVEGLETMTKLEELYISNQKITAGTHVTFSPSSLNAIQNSLCILKCSGNNLPTPLVFSVLHNLRVLDISSNSISGIDGVISLLSFCTQLTELDLRGNEVCKVVKYRESLVASSPSSLVLLDGKETSNKERIFLQHIQGNRKSKKPTENTEKPLPPEMEKPLQESEGSENESNDSQNGTPITVSPSLRDSMLDDASLSIYVDNSVSYPPSPIPSSPTPTLYSTQFSNSIPVEPTKAFEPPLPLIKQAKKKPNKKFTSSLQPKKPAAIKKPVLVNTSLSLGAWGDKKGISIIKKP